MKDDDIAQVEGKLGIRMPAEFRAAVQAQGSRLRGAVCDAGVGSARLAVDQIYLTADRFVQANVAERASDATGRHFPGWERTFVLVGSNGAGDFYALRLDGGPGVWLIGTRCGSVPTRTYDSLDEFIGDLDIRGRGDPDSHFDPPASADERAFLANITADPDDDLRRLVFADWLEEHGQGERATFIRARVALDARPPDFGTYADAIEQLRSVFRDVRGEMPPGFKVPMHNYSLPPWYGGMNDSWERGLPSLAVADMEAADEADAVRLQTIRLATLLDTTPVRGLSLWHGFPPSAAGLLATAPAGQLTRLKIDVDGGDISPCPFVEALAGSPAAGNLTRLDLSRDKMDSATARCLAATRFDQLRRLDAGSIGHTSEVIQRVVDAPWFSRLEHLELPLPPGIILPTSMPHLHTLSLRIWAGSPLKDFIDRTDLPRLRRLWILGGTFDGKQAEVLADLRCEELVELRIRGSKIRSANLKAILAAPWARRLEVFLVEVKATAAALNVAVDKNPCAKTLRIRTVKGLAK